MVFSGLVHEQRITNQRSSRNGTAITSFIIHHQASTNVDAVLNMMVSGSREVSSNYVISNEGRIYGVVPEEHRAWTSGSSSDGGRGASWDRKSITFEIENESAGGAWPVSSAAHEATAAVIADAAQRYGIPINRETVVGHRELWSRYNASYPTACPGGIDLDWLVNRANQIIAAGGSKPSPAPTPPSGGGGGTSGVEFGEEAGISSWTNIQNWLKKDFGYTGSVDGIPGKLTWTSLQRYLRGSWGYSGIIDGIPGKLSWTATQKWLKAHHGYSGVIDGVPGPLTFNALKRAGESMAPSPAPSPNPGGLPKTVIDGIPGPITWRRLQTWLKRDWGYEGDIDGDPGRLTWSAFQRFLKQNHGYKGIIDGIPGKLTYSALQRFAKEYGYSGPVDGIPGRQTWMAIQRFANSV